MKTKEAILSENKDPGQIDWDTAILSMQEYADQQTAQLREAYTELLALYVNLLQSNVSSEKYITREWLERAGLKEKE